MVLTLSNIVLIIAAAQASLLSLLIFQKHQNLFANRFLALLMGSYTIILIHLLLQDAGYYKYIPQLFIVVGIPLAAFPLHYFYTKYLITRAITFRKNDWFHFLPFICFELILLSGNVSGTMDFSAISMAGPTETPILFQLFNVAIIIQGLMYFGTSYRLILNYNKHIKDILSSIEHVQLHWLRNITIAGISAQVLFLAELLLLAYGMNVSDFVLSSIVFAVYVYGMGYVGLLKTEIFASPNVEREMNEVVKIESVEINESSGKYERSGLSEETAQTHLQQLLQVMDGQKPYLNSQLTLSQLASVAGISPHNLSEIINSLRRQNFYDFINSYRIEQVKKDLADPSKQHLKILSIAFDAGFNSKATFNTLFKEQIEKTPSEYRRSVLQTIGDE
ncbi:MAG: helix-turn-helix transcriptional regulator [Bacteroidota bacterium]|nr:helix-turn-helix transcriptional regulator [Bacteroidota bacterium]